ncbi:MAG TPA: formate dehydrogenase accessory sulfurtransferase FdhD [Candidatus Binataceae bacterium]|nr:formate dehydrogenase accessory sulfurtransferase FdhD [Candidatus Binataceae bacterium]
MSESVKDYAALKFRDGAADACDERLVVEEPLEIRLAGRRFTVTMRTPGHDEELITGFLLAEGLVTMRADIDEIRHVRSSKGEPEPNVFDVILRVKAEELSERLKRNFVLSSSCGVCGKTSIESLEQRIAIVSSDLHVPSGTITALPSLMNEAQQIFAATGGLHAAALFDASVADAPGLIVLREDVGRHNAVDKVIGYAVMNDGLPLRSSILMVSGRVSFEIVQKTAAAGIPLLCAVSAPSSLGVELADELGLTLIGFLRGNSFNVYTHRERIIL